MKPDLDTVKTDLRSHIVKAFLAGDDSVGLSDELELQQSGVLNSVNTLELVGHLEETYDISVTAHEIATEMNSIQNIAALVVEKAG